MNRQMFNAVAAQCATPEVSGDGAVAWESGKKCVIPSVKLYGAALQDGTPTPDAPMMPVCNNGVFVARGRNLMKMDYPSRTQNGITFDVLPDGGVKISGTSTASATLTSYKAFGNSELRTLPAGTYNFTGLPYNADLSASIHYYDLDGTFHSVHALSDNGVTIVLSGPVTYYFQVSILGSGKTVDAMIYLQLVRDDAVHVYTPYYDGGQAQVPELWAIPGTDYRDEWDPQMGRGVRRVAENTLDGITEGKKFVAVHNVTPADVFVVQQKEMYPPPGLSGMNDDPNMLSNYFGYGTGYYTNSVGAFKQTVATWGIVCRLPYSMFGIEKGEKTNDELLALANNWLAEKAAEGTPLTWWYALGTPQPFYSPPARLTQPTGYGQIIQISGDIPDCPIAARYLKHS